MRGDSSPMTLNRFRFLKAPYDEEAHKQQPTIYN